MRAILAVLVLAVASVSAFAAERKPRTLTIEEFDALQAQGCPDGYIEDMSQGVCVPKTVVDWAWKAVGQARVVDGDKLELISPRFYVCPAPDPCPKDFSRSGNMKIRLHGIDALEMDQVCLDERDAPWPCGEAAYYHLVRLIDGDDVTCFGGGSAMDEVGRYGRRLAKCHVWARVDLNAAMVWDGYALAYRRYSEDYLYAENGARATSAGMWSGDFVDPWEWRQWKSAPSLDSLRNRIERALEQGERNKI